MNQAIKTISLDDVGETQAAADPQAALHYSPQYVNSSGLTQNDTRSGSFTQATRTIGTSEESSLFGTALTRMTEIFGDVEDAKKKRLFFLAGALICLIGATLYFTSVEDFDSEPVDLESPVSESPVSESAAIEPSRETPMEAAPPPSKVSAAVTETVPAASPPVDPLINPYWSMPNPLEGGFAGVESLSQSQEERWRFSLTHPFPYQRFKTVQEIRRAQLRGSEFILTDVLSQPKFWTRMEALFAMAEMGLEVDVDTVEGAIGNTRRSLVQNYFRRFRKKANDAEIYIMRQAVRVVDAPARIVILSNLALRRDPTNDLYLIAASYDPNAKVKEWAAGILGKSPAAPELSERFNSIVAGENMPSETPQTRVETEMQGDPKSEATSPEGANPSVNVEEVYFLNEDATTSRDDESSLSMPEDPSEEGEDELE